MPGAPSSVLAPSSDARSLQGPPSAALAAKSALPGQQSTAPATKSALQGPQSSAILPLTLFGPPISGTPY